MPIATPLPTARQANHVKRPMLMGALAIATVLTVGVAAMFVLRASSPAAPNPIQATIGPMLDAALPTDLDRFSIDGDLFTLANCEGRLRDATRERYGDSPDVMFGTVQDYVHRPFPIRFKAERAATGHWTILPGGFSQRDATPADVRAQVEACATALTAKLDRALARKANRDRNAAAWTSAKTSP